MTDSVAVLDQLRSSYYSLSAAVQEGVHAFVGNESRLVTLREDVFAFMQYAERVRRILEPDVLSQEEYAQLEQGTHAWLLQIDTEAQKAQDMADGNRPEVAYKTRTGRRGRPKIEVHPGLLAEGLQLRGGPSTLTGVSWNDQEETLKQYNV
ncbi:hypothetical protein DL96DRAFT_1711896 [Flagelloscypha sp. PMI_526]|nr:hypothetical protein DL96DRAFT_1711896 [Flagelloscypha sp. PMI_526]